MNDQAQAILNDARAKFRQGADLIRAELGDEHADSYERLFTDGKLLAKRLQVGDRLIITSNPHLPMGSFIITKCGFKAGDGDYVVLQELGIKPFDVPRYQIAHGIDQGAVEYLPAQG